MSPAGRNTQSSAARTPGAFPLDRTGSNGAQRTIAAHRRWRYPLRHDPHLAQPTDRFRDVVSCPDLHGGRGAATHASPHIAPKLALPCAETRGPAPWPVTPSAHRRAPGAASPLRGRRSSRPTRRARRLNGWTTSRGAWRC